MHIGSEELGKIADHGFTVKELAAIRDNMHEQFKVEAQLIDLSQKLPGEARKGNEAAVLYLP